MSRLDTVTISLNELRVGGTCSHPIESDSGLLLLGAKSRVTNQVITRLRERGIETIEVHPSDLASLRDGEKPKAKKAIQEQPKEKKNKVWAEGVPVKEMLVDRHDEDFSKERTQRLKRAMGAAKQQFESLKEQLTTGNLESVSKLFNLSDAYARSIVDDHDQTVGVMGTATAFYDLAERNVRMSVLGISVGVELGLEGSQILEVGLSGLLHDIGLYSMDPRFTQQDAILTNAEIWEYKKHPLVSLKHIEEFMDVPNSVRLAIQQVHEQMDGSGYPRGLSGQRIHQYARILNVVDAYIQLTTESATQQAVVPHDALGLMLHQAGKGLFDTNVIKAFLVAETLFPLGSMVELKNGDVCQVIRRPKSGYAAPVVKSSDETLIDLESTNLEIVRPVPDPYLSQIRLTQDQMQSAVWDPASCTFDF